MPDRKAGHRGCTIGLNRIPLDFRTGQDDRQLLLSETLRYRVRGKIDFRFLNCDSRCDLKVRTNEPPILCHKYHYRI